MKQAWCQGWGRGWAQWARAMCLFMGALSMGHAQTNDQGTLDFSGTITKTTCVLSFGDAQSTLSGVKTLSFGSIAASKIPTTEEKIGFSGTRSFTISVQNAAGETCDSIGSSKWDVQVQIPTEFLRPRFFDGPAVTHAILSTSNAKDADGKLIATREIGIILRTAIGNNALSNPLSLLNASTANKVFLSDPSQTTPQLSAGQTLTVQAEFTTTSAQNGSSRLPAPYTASIPLTVLYK